MSALTISSRFEYELLASRLEIAEAVKSLSSQTSEALMKVRFEKVSRISLINR